MPDIIQVAEDLKNAPDQWLAQQMQQPSGTAPPWLVASEVARRERLRSGAAKAQAPQSSVSQDLIKSLYARIPPTAGLMPQAPQPPGMPPVNLTPGSNPSTLGAAPGGTPPGNFKMPARMASGGQYDEDDDEEGDRYLYNLPMSKPSRRAQMDQLMGPRQIHDAVMGLGQTERNAIGSMVPRQVNDAMQGMGQTERNIAGGIAGDYGTAAGQVNNTMQGLGATERNVMRGMGGDYMNAGRAVVNAAGNAAGQVNNAMRGVAQTGRNAMGSVLDRLRGNGSPLKIPEHFKRLDEYERISTDPKTGRTIGFSGGIWYDPYTGAEVPAPAPAAMPAPQQASAPVPQQAPAPIPQQAPAPVPQQAPRANPPDEITRLINDAAQRYQLPPDLIREVIRRESNFRPDAIGPKTDRGEHAMGLMQVLPSTAGDYGVTDQAELLDPARNVDVGTRHLKKMLALFNGDVPTALAAYNEGQGNVMKQQRAGKPYFNETQNYIRNITSDINAQRKQLNLPPLTDPQIAGLSSRMLGPQDPQTGPQETRTTQPAAPAANVTMPAGAGAVNMTTDVAPVTPGAPVTKATVAKKEPLHQSWMPPGTSPEADIIQRQIEARQQGHQSVEDRQRALYQPENLNLLNAAGRSIFGEPQDYTKYTTAINQVMAMAQKQMHPNIGQGLIDWGMAMMANPSHNFGVAMGQSGAYAMGKYQTQRQQGMTDFLTAARAGIELQEKTDAYNARIGQYKMQRLGAQETGVTADERAFQSDINSLQRQKNTAQINYEKALTTPSAVNTMAMAIMNREGIQFDPKGPEPIKQLEAVGSPALLQEAYLAGKTGGAGARTSSVERTQDMRATSLLAMMKHTWNPDENPDDAQFPNATKKLEKMYPELLSLATTAAGANLPEQMREAQGIVDEIIAGRGDPNMTGMYGKQVLVKYLLESEHKFDLVRATQDFNAIKAFMNTMQSGQQIAYRNNVNFVDFQLPQVVNAYANWKRAITAEVPDFLTQYKGFNNLALQAAINLGGQAGAAARALVGHIAELQSGLPGVYSGGYAPHDEDLKRVKLMIDSSWDDASFAAGLKVIGDTIIARKAAVNMSMPFGVSPASPYTKGLPGSQAPGAVNTQQLQQQAPVIEQLPGMLSPGDKDKTFLAPNGKKVKILEVDPNNWHRYRFVEVP